jgi:uncharacterized membrane protein
VTLDAFLKTAHVLGAIVFVGNVIVTGVWTAIFWRARHTHDFRRAALLTVSGITLALQRGLPLWDTPWIRQALVALTLSTVLWLVVLVPAQRRMVQHTGGANDEPLVRAYGRWSVWGWTATAPLVYAVWCMVAKPG